MTKISWWLARFLLRLHCFLNLHEPHYSHYHFDNGVVTLWKMECKFCRKLFYVDRQIEKFALLTSKVN